jgi:hypothetical protein
MHCEQFCTFIIKPCTANWLFSTVDMKFDSSVMLGHYYDTCIS